MTDAVLFNKWRSERDAEAFRELASRYSGMVYATCLRVLRNPQEAEEAAQECFEKLAGAPHITAPYLGPWLHKVATNRALDRLRHEGRRRAREDRYALERGADHTPEWDDIYPLVDEAIAELPEELRAPLVHHFLEGRTHESIAQELGVPRPTVTYRIQRALERVRQTLKRRGVTVMSATFATLMGEKMAEAAVVPAALEAALGRIAVAGLTAAPVAAGGAFALFGSVAAKVLLGAAASALALGLAWHTFIADDTVATPAAPVEQANAPFEKEAAPKPVPAATAPSPAPAAAAANVPPSEGGVLTGRVYDAKTTRGIAGIDVMAMHIETNNGDSAISDKDGLYRIAGLPPGTYRVQLTGHVEGYAERRTRSVEATVALEEPAGGVDFAVQPAVPVLGRVVSADGAPVEGVKVGAMFQDDPESVRATTKADGSFRLDMNGPGSGLQIVAKSETFQSKLERRDSLGPEGLDGVELVLTEPLTAVIEGKLLLEDGRPAAGYSLHPESGSTGYLVGLSDADVGPDGAFRVDKLAAGTYDFVYEKPGQEMWNSSDTVGELTVEEGQALKDVVLRIGREEGFTVSGRVVNKSGQGIEKVQITANAKNGLRLTSTDTQGAFVLHGLDEGLQYIQAQPEYGTYSPTSAPGVPAGTRDLTLVLEGVGRIEGRVLNARDGKPLTSFETYLSTSGRPEFHPDLLINRRDVSDPDGKFVREKVSVGPQTIIVKAPGYAPMVQVVTGVADQTVACADFRLEPAARLAGRVVDEEGKPVNGAGIYADSYSTWMSSEEALARTDADGRFSMDLLSDATHVMVYAVTLPPVRVPIREVENIVLRKGGVVEGRVTVNGKPAERCAVFDMADVRRFVQAITGPDGAYKLEGVATDTTGIRARLESREITQEVSVEAGATVIANFDFSGGNAVVEGSVSEQGKPVADGMVTLSVESDAGTENFTARVDENGDYVFPNLAAGHALITYMGYEENRSTVRRAEFDLAADQTFRHDFELYAPGSVNGRVAGATAGFMSMVLLLTPDVEVPVKLDNTVFREVFERNALSTAACEADGSYELRRIPAGKWLVVAVLVEQGEKDPLPNARMASATVQVDNGPVTLDLSPQ
ncbi:MAG: sigma-70 family RNA polymerase sigma factor [FCB group bacterium]|jgi:RNA polymerase sigma factor (sigma-70 family)|nr:sigma-70 family RNA polymerase sigma factor [FCB group bacterium]